MASIERNSVSRAILRIAEQNNTAVLVASRTTPHAEVARRLGLPKQTQQEWRDKYLADTALMLAAYGLKLVPVEEQTYGDDDIAAMQHLAQKGLAGIRPIQKHNGGTVVDNEGDA